MNEIVTFGNGYNLTPGIKVFVKSSSRFCGKLTVIAENLSKDLLLYLKENNVNIIDARQHFAKFNIDSNLSPYTLKVIYFYLYCKYYCSSTNVYLCDFTDIFVQKNIFELIQTCDKAYVTSENCIIKNCETNSTWIKICYNNDILVNLLGKHEILNGGNILGNISPVTCLLKEMCNDMEQIIKRIGNYQNIDQASLNKVVHFDSFRYIILNNKEIVNLAHSSDMTDFSKAYAIHQYDVNKTLERILFQKHE